MKLVTAAATIAVALLVGWVTLFAQSPSFPAVGTVNADSNLRAGPGTDYSIVGSAAVNEPITLADCNTDCSWFLLDTDTWIAAFLVDVEISDHVQITVTRVSTASALIILPTVTPTPRKPIQPTATLAETSATTQTVLPTPTSAQVLTSTPTSNTSANLRSGPGTSYEIVGSVVTGQALEIVGVSIAGDWYQLADDSWIAAFLVRNPPDNINIVETISIPLPTATSDAATTSPSVEASQAVDIPKDVSSESRPLIVEFINPHYECEIRELEREATPGITERYWGYRSFQVDMYVRNNGTEPVLPPWQPKRWIVTNGTDEMVNDVMWQWVHRDTGFYKQPPIDPGSVTGWTFVMFPLAQGEWIKAVEFVWQDEIYRQEFDLGPYGNAHNYVDCGQASNYSNRPTPTPRP